jgi:hypothetical protein
MLTYKRRSDGRIAVVLDNNVWDFLFDRNISLVSQFRADEFVLFIPREGEIEKDAIPDDEARRPLREYIRHSIHACGIKTTYVFGFALPAGQLQRHGGFGQGPFQSQTEREFYAVISERFLIGKGERNSGLTANEADAAVAAKSFFAVVLTDERPEKPGPLRVAAEHGGKVLHLQGFDSSGLSLREYVIAFERA